MTFNCSYVRQRILAAFRTYCPVVLQLVNKIYVVKSGFPEKQRAVNPKVSKHTENRKALKEKN